MTIFEEIQTLTRANGVPTQEPNQTTQSYLLKLAMYIQNCPAEQWNTLSIEAKEWYDSAVRACNGMKSIPEPAGYSSDLGVLKTVQEEVVINVTTPEPVTASTSITVSTPEKKTAVIKSIDSGRTQSATPNKANVPKHSADIPAVLTVNQIGTSIVKSEKKPKGNGILDAIRKTVIEHLDWTAKQVHQHLSEHGFPEIKLDVVAVNAGDIRRVVACVKELGYWQDQPVQKQ